MPTSHNVYDTWDLLGVFRELEPVPRFWRRWFPGTFQSLSETIEFNKIMGTRRLAPFVMPTVEGEPIRTLEEKLYAVQPAYIKMKDPVSATGLIRRAAGFGELNQATPLSPAERYDAMVAATLQQHRDAWERRLEWMCAQALLTGSLTIEDQRYPEVTIDYLRQAGNTITVAGGNRWDQADADIIQQLDSWNNTMTRAPFGASASDLLMTPAAWEAFRKNSKAREQLNVNIRGTTGQFDIGVGDGTRYQFKGQLGGSLNLWLYADYYETPDGTSVSYMTDKDVLLIAPPGDVGGVMAYGAIQDLAANLQALDIFIKMWDAEDPSATMILTQSAPVPVLVNPNRALKARVIT